ncbi:hypothetical protein GY45DRAFT_451419 [Cubamyces sp. BRFM 1775]|nr:hypothetical protein GY45DRAFT_451419 [Cubamyces sp. BRFM 1775]
MFPFLGTSARLTVISVVRWLLQGDISALCGYVPAISSLPAPFISVAYVAYNSGSVAGPRVVYKPFRCKWPLCGRSFYDMHSPFSSFAQHRNMQRSPRIPYDSPRRSHRDRPEHRGDSFLPTIGVSAWPTLGTNSNRLSSLDSSVPGLSPRAESHHSPTGRFVPAQLPAISPLPWLRPVIRPVCGERLGPLPLVPRYEPELEQNRSMSGSPYSTPGSSRSGGTYYQHTGYAAASKTHKSGGSSQVPVGSPHDSETLDRRHQYCTPQSCH